jgi:hypothetical protein
MGKRYHQPAPASHDRTDLIEALGTEGGLDLVAAKNTHLRRLDPVARVRRESLPYERL